MRMHHKRRRLPPVLGIEHLEVRNLPSAIPLADLTIVVAEAEPNNTLDRANDLGLLARTLVTGTINDDGADVDWFVFTLSEPSTITLKSTAGTIGLYNSSYGDFNDRLDPIGPRQLAQDGTSDSQTTEIIRSLAAGTYFVAVSGGGNLYFNPFIESSGLSGTHGDYELSLVATSLNISSDATSTALAVDASAMIVRFDLSTALTFVPAVELTDALGATWPVQWTNHNPGIAELQIAPARPFLPGSYQAVVKDEVGNIRLTLPFQVVGTVDGMAVDQRNDKPATSVSLGGLEQLGLVQIVAAIGDDARYDFSSLDPALYPGNDVDLYHFQINSTVPTGLQAEVFAGRIGSPLDAGLSLFRLDHVTGHLLFVAGNNQSYNPTPSTNRASSLFYDPLLTVSLSAGDYYLAVSHGSNTLSPTEHQVRDDESGIFDPEVTHSGTAGWNVGHYVLNLQAVTIPDPPEVSSVSIVGDSVLIAAPTTFSVQFTEYMNLTGLAFSAFQATSESTIGGVYFQDALGNKIFPRLTSYDPTSFTAEFLLLDRLAAGSYQLHLSGRQGLTNIAGGPLVGNTPEGDYVVRFEVATTAAGTDGNPLVWTHVEVSDADDSPQQLGVIFPHELQAGVQFVRADAGDSTGRHDKSDEYRFEILQNQTYLLHLSGDSLPKGVQIQLVDQLGHSIEGEGLNDGHTLFLQLRAGTYTLRVGDWSTGQARHLSYRIEFNLEGVSDNAPPLLSGPSPAVGIRLASSVGQDGVPGSGSGIPVPGSGSSGNIGPSPAPSSSTLVGNNGSPISTPLNIGRQGLPRVVVPLNSGNVAIAIPAFPSTAGSRSRVASQVTLPIRKTMRTGSGPQFQGLVGIADGPIGTTNADNQDHLFPTLNALRKLNTLIGATFTSEVSPHEDTDAAEASDPDTDNEPGDSSDRATDLLNAETDTQEGKPAKGEAEHTQSQAMRGMDLDGDNERSKSWNDPAFIPASIHVKGQSGVVQGARLAWPGTGAGDIAEMGGLSSTLQPYVLWASGIGAALLHLAADGVNRAGSQVSPSNLLQVRKRDGKQHQAKQS